MSDEPVGCGRVTGTVGNADSPTETAPSQTVYPAEEDHVTARVGQEAPDFTAPAYYQGTFTNVQLSDHKGKWLLLCFYPGDFTFV